MLLFPFNVFKTIVFYANAKRAVFSKSLSGFLNMQIVFKFFNFPPAYVKMLYGSLFPLYHSSSPCMYTGKIWQHPIGGPAFPVDKLSGLPPFPRSSLPIFTCIKWQEYSNNHEKGRIQYYEQTVREFISDEQVKDLYIWNPR